MTGKFIPSAHSFSGSMSTGVATANATNTPSNPSSSQGSIHRDDDQFLGLHWKNVAVTLMVGTMAAVVADIAVMYVRKQMGIRREEF
jgi:hypothetical protein